MRPGVVSKREDEAVVRTGVCELLPADRLWIHDTSVVSNAVLHGSCNGVFLFDMADSRLFFEHHRLRRDIPVGERNDLVAKGSCDFFQCLVTCFTKARVITVELLAREQ